MRRGYAVFTLAALLAACAADQFGAAPVDGGGSEAATPGDSGSEAAPPIPDAAKPNFCSSVEASLCDDFDTTALGTVWGGDAAIQIRQGTAGLSNVAASKPYSFESTVEPAEAGATYPNVPHATLQHTFLVVPATVDLEFDFSFGENPSVTGSFAFYQIASLDFDPGLGGIAFSLGLGPNGGDAAVVPHLGLNLAAVAGTTFDLGVAPPAATTWTHAKVHVVLDAGTAGALKVEIDHVVKLDKQNINTLPPSVISSTLALGPISVGQPLGLHLRIDNFVFDLK